MKEKEINEIFDELFPICRSITGKNYRKSLRILGRYIKFKYLRYRSGKKVFDWTVPQEWNITDAYIKKSNKKIIDFKKNNLHVVNYSIPINKEVSLEKLKNHLFSIKKYPNIIPYVTSYYKRYWGFCLEHSKKKKLKKGKYKVVIKSSLNTGYLENALAKIKGNTKKIVLLSSYLCHPSMANNELSGPLVLLGLYKKIKKWKKRNFNYYFLINPETIGSICFLSTYRKLLQKNLHSGLVLTCLGGSKNKLSYKKSRSENNSLDRLFLYLNKKRKCLVRDFNPSDGSDERQYCSSELNLPVGQIARSVYGEYYQYHTSGDNKKFMKIKKVFDSINFLEKILKINDSIFPLIRKEPYCELQLGKRKLYPNINFESSDKKKSSDNLIDNREQLNILMGILSYADGKHDILDVAEKLNIDIEKFPKVLDIALKNKLILL